MTQLDTLRQSINDIDQNLVDLLAKRFELSRQVGIYKKENSLNSVDSKRLDEVLELVSSKAVQQNINPDMIKSILLTIHEYVVDEHNLISGKPSNPIKIK